MDSSFIKFGDVFNYNENDYVFLAKTEDIVYAAQILDEKDTHRVTRLSEIRAKDPKSKKYDNSLFCFVILSTDSFKDRMAHLRNTQQDNGLFFDSRGSLDEVDLKKIKDEICGENGHIPIELKELVSQITL